MAKQHNFIKDRFDLDTMYCTKCKIFAWKSFKYILEYQKKGTLSSTAVRNGVRVLFDNKVFRLHYKTGRKMAKVSCISDSEVMIREIIK